MLVPSHWGIARSPGEPEKHTVTVCSILGSGDLDAGVCGSAYDPQSVLDEGITLKI